MITEKERIRNREAQKKFRESHPRYSAKYPERQRRYWSRLTAKKQGKEITNDIAIRHRVKKTTTQRNKQDAEYRKVYYKNLKTIVLTHYGGGKLSCVQCGESRIECLSIDHINGGGNSHRREILKTRYCSGTYNWLKKNCFPEGFQTLCMNCQFIKRITNKELIKHNSNITITQPQLTFTELTTTQPPTS